MEKSIKKIIKQTLHRMDMDSEEARELIYHTGKAESGYRNLEQINGPALGFFQVEPDTAYDIWKNYVFYRPEMRDSIWSLGFLDDDVEFCLLSNIALQVAFCRLQYRRDKHPLPGIGDYKGQAEYWKRVYNTEKGRGTIKHFLKAIGV
mgnify:FL=1